MSPILVAVLAITAPAAEPAKSGSLPPGVVAVDAPDATPRKGYELRDAIRKAFKRWAKPSDAEAEEAARELISLFIELQRDDELARPQWKSLQTKVRNRLLELRDQIARKVAIARRLEKERARKARGLAGDKSDSLSSGTSDDSYLLDPALARGGGAMGAADYGQGLVDLIQTVVRPQSWDVQGGPGSIFYWYPGKALVIRQTDEIHEEILGVLEQLRRM
jgi:hypothetical protein